MRDAKKHLQALETCCQLIRTLRDSNSRRETIDIALQAAKTHVSALKKTVAFDHADIARLERCKHFLERFDSISSVDSKKDSNATLYQ